MDPVQAPVRLPSVLEIRGELVAIRSKPRLSYKSINDNGPLIRQLPAVDDEIARNGHPEGNRTPAAMHVIECAVERKISDPRLKSILQITLPITSPHEAAEGKGDDKGQGEHRTKMHERYEAASANVGCGDSRGTHFVGLVETAYRELASVLVRSETSPCRGPKADHTALLATLADTKVSELELLSMAGLVLSRDLRERLSALILDRYPKSLARARLPTGRRGANAIVELGWVIERALLGYESDGPDQVPLLSAAELKKLLVTRGGRALNTRVTDVATAYSSRTGIGRPRGPIPTEFYIAKEASLQFLVNALRLIEIQSNPRFGARGRQRPAPIRSETTRPGSEPAATEE